MPGRHAATWPALGTGFGLARTVALRDTARDTPVGARLGQNPAP
ncbi:hypothetical protein [Streptomyces cyslabdanicus]